MGDDQDVGRRVPSQGALHGASDSESRCAVASSRIDDAGALSSSRAMARRCFSPPETVAAVAHHRVQAVGQRL